MQNIPAALNALAPFKQFILWQAILKDDGKFTKIPVSPHTLKKFDDEGNGVLSDPNEWVDGATACSICNVAGTDYGVGFVFTRLDPFFFVDIDNCLDENNDWSPLAVELMTAFNGAAIEVSHSQKALHIIGQGRPVPHGCRNTKLNIEYYTESRFVALTGHNIVGDAATDHTEALFKITNDYFPPSRASASGFEWTKGPVENWNGPTDDGKLIERASKSKSIAGTLGGRATFVDLFTGNEKQLSEHFPESTDGEPYNRSSADAALASHLAFWTGKDCDRIRRLMELSALKRKKWNRKGHDYLKLTIENACLLCDDVLGASVEPEAPVEPAQVEANVPEITLKKGFQFLAGAMQADYFKGCVYIRSLHRVLIPSGEVLKPDQFKATYGGYIFALDADGEKTTKNAFEAFTESQVVSYPQATNPAFKPEIEPGKLFYEDGLLNVNTYTPAHVRLMQGDVSPFLDHLALLLPDEGDRRILTAYMAACIQHKGIKFQWAPLIQGAPGNGKTLLTRAVRYAVGRKYTHMPKANDLDNKFNGWLQGKILIGVEDIYVPEHRAEIIEALKPMITGGDGIEIQFKGADQITVDVCANFILNSNHKDAIRKDEDERRFSMFFTAQQSKDDINAAGMGGDYFPRLYQWLNGDGYAITANYLSTYKIPYELNPAGGCIRAPLTSSTAEAIQAGKGRVESEILEAIDEGRQGFAGGWVSSKRLDDLLENTRSDRVIPRNKRRELMRSLGYDYHPALREGRVNNIIITEGGKPRLYVKAGHVALNLKTSAEVSKAYEAAQTGQNIMHGVVSNL